MKNSPDHFHVTSEYGFTLIEVVVALAIVAIALSAIIRTSGSFIGNQVYLRDRTFAHWVARNALTEWQVSKKWPAPGQQKGTTEFGNREWEWSIQVTQTEEAKMRRLDIEVRSNADDDGALAVLSGFVKQPD